MPAHLRRSESATRGLKRLLFQRFAACLRLLAVPRLDDDAIHALRRNLKQCRAYLLLLRPALGKAAWRREDAALDAAARNFTTLRDRHVLHDTVDALVTGCGEPLIEAFAGEFRPGADVGVTELPERLARISRIQLTRSRTRLRRTRLTARNWSLLGPALRRSYRSARRAQAEASDTGSDEMFSKSGLASTISVMPAAWTAAAI